MSGLLDCVRHVTTDSGRVVTNEPQITLTKKEREKEREREREREGWREGWIEGEREREVHYHPLFIGGGERV